MLKTRRASSSTFSPSVSERSFDIDFDIDGICSEVCASAGATPASESVARATADFKLSLLCFRLLKLPSGEDGDMERFYHPGGSLFAREEIIGFFVGHDSGDYLPARRRDKRFEHLVDCSKFGDQFPDELLPFFRIDF